MAIPPDQPLSLSRTRELLARLGHQPRHALGQNFLVDPNIVAKSVALAEIGPGDDVVEIGPGLGTLTRALLAAGARVWAVETDHRLADYLAAELAPAFPGHLDLCRADAVERPRGRLPCQEIAKSLKVVANLPYAIISPWFAEILHPPLPLTMVLMVQREAADRLCAPAGTKHFGPMSIFLQGAYERRPGHPVARSAFFPPPEVDSVLLHLRRLPAPVLLPAEVRAAIRRIFTQRRKQLRPLLRREPLLADFAERLTAWGYPPTVRAEEVAAAHWLACVPRLLP